jgi:hypothetical protein
LGLLQEEKQELQAQLGQVDADATQFDANRIATK